MSTKIKGAEYPLSKIFSSDFDYEIPSYQRPYAWTEDEAGELFDDLYDFFVTESEEEQYFLGSIVLVKEDDKPHADVIDGQQRLTTLSILLAAITSKLSGAEHADFEGYLKEPGRPSQGLKPKPRLQIRKRDNDFFKQYIQDMKFEELFKLDETKLDTEAKVNITKNAKLLMDRLDKTFSNEDNLVAFGAYLVQRCFLVAVSTPTREAAFRIFTVMNSRGMSLLATDIIKADVIGKIDESIRSDYNDLWEEMEIEVGRNGFNELLGHIRMITTKAKAKKSLQEEFYKYVLPDITSDTAVDFVDNVLLPYSDAFGTIKECSYVSQMGAEGVNDILKWLNRIDNSDWVPVAMRYYVDHSNDAEKLEQFLRKLERLAAFMRALSWDVTHRIERYGKIIAELEADGDGFGETIELTHEEIDAFLQTLESDMYKMVSKKRNYLILRLDSFVSDGAAVYDSKVLTIEHVLPQTVASGSQWEKWWPDLDEREEWVHKIANLLPLTKRHNSEAQNYDFALKKEKYFTGKAGTTSFALTTQVLSYNKWTPDVLKTRQEELIKTYRDNWNLYY